MRADGQRNLSSILRAAVQVFATSGVDAPVREIAEAAGVGLGTVYRHFPERSDMIVAVMQSQIDACADAAVDLAGKYAPGDALARWLQRYVDFIGTKRGLATALHFGNPAYTAVPQYFSKRLQPALKTLLDAAVRARAIRPGIDANDLLRAVAMLCHGPHDEEPGYARRMVALLVDGLRYGANKPAPPKRNIEPTSCARDLDSTPKPCSQAAPGPRHQIVIPSEVKGPAFSRRRPIPSNPQVQVVRSTNQKAHPRPSLKGFAGRSANKQDSNAKRTKKPGCPRSRF
jgi:AcrR family transcriptional regulator